MTAPRTLSWASNLTAVAALGFAALGAHAADPIRIGFTGPLSGSLSLLGNGVRDGLQTYVELVNSQGGINGRKIELIAEDDGYDPTRTLAAAKKLAEQDNVLALVSPTGTPNVAALVPYATERKLPILFPYAFSNTLTTPTKRYVFTTLPEVRVQANVLGDYLVNEVKQKKIAAIYQNDDFGQDAVLGLEQRLAKETVAVPLTKLPFDRGTTNFSGVVAQARQAGADSVVFLGIPRDAALVMKEANKMGWKPQFSGHNALGDPQTFALAGTNLVEGAIAVAVMEPLDSAKPQVAEFMANQKKFLPKTNPTTYSLHGYTAGKIFVEALRGIKGEINGESLVASLESINGYDTGLMAPVTFTKDQHAGSVSVAFMRAKAG
ncbi:MAG: branched-chain amino acid transporter substrate-binding protein, partial [Rhizobacter sp.]|nr:branched-chain amino acid transporter substrate-binding protein [Rhizobacter sp.]